MSDRDKEFLLYYRRHRVEDQQGYYFDRSAWHQRRANTMIVAAGVLMFLSSAASWWGSQGGAVIWLVLATALPAVSGAIVAVRGLYEFERNHSRFLNTYYDLRRAAVETRPPDSAPAGELREATARYVAEIENLLSRENRQWVSMMASSDKSRRREGSQGQER